MTGPWRRPTTRGTARSFPDRHPDGGGQVGVDSLYSDLSEDGCERREQRRQKRADFPVHICLALCCFQMVKSPLDNIAVPEADSTRHAGIRPPSEACLLKKSGRHHCTATRPRPSVFRRAGGGRRRTAGGCPAASTSSWTGRSSRLRGTSPSPGAAPATSGSSISRNAAEKCLPSGRPY